MLEAIQAEIRRVIGAAGVEVCYETRPEVGEFVRVETAEAVWDMLPEDLLELLSRLPDRAGVLAFREEADRHPRKIMV